MSEVEFYLKPSNCYGQITVDDICNLQDVINFLHKNENIYVPNEFYDVKDGQGISASDYLFSNGGNDETRLLYEIICKKSRPSEKTYHFIENNVEYGYVLILQNDSVEEQKCVCVHNIVEKDCEKYIEVDDVVKVKRHYLGKAETYDEYIVKLESSFNKLIFHDGAFKYIGRLGKLPDVRDELTRHLIILNDVASSLYRYYGGNEKRVLDELKSSYDIICSGKGANEKEEYNCNMMYDGKNYVLTCNPHTKLFQAHTNQRIYFCWGRAEIDSHKIIVARIGDHWGK